MGMGMAMTVPIKHPVDALALYISQVSSSAYLSNRVINVAPNAAPYGDGDGDSD